MLTGRVLVNISCKDASFAFVSSSTALREPPAELAEEIDHVLLCLAALPGFEPAVEVDFMLTNESFRFLPTGPLAESSI